MPAYASNSGSTNALNKDGSNQPTAAIDWGNQNLTDIKNLGATDLTVDAVTTITAANSPIVSVGGTLSSASGDLSAVSLNFNTTGASSGRLQPFNVTMNAGTSSSGGSTCATFTNNTSTSGSSPSWDNNNGGINQGFVAGANGTSSTGANLGFFGYAGAGASPAKWNIGALGWAYKGQDSAGYQGIGFLGLCNFPSASPTNFTGAGLYGNLSTVHANQAGVGIVQAVSAAVVGDVGDTSQDIFAGVAGSTAKLFRIDSAGGLRIKEATNGRAGTATLSAGTITVANTSVTANTRVCYWRQTSGGTLGELSVTLSAGVSFTISSTSATETSTIYWELREPA